MTDYCIFVTMLNEQGVPEDIVVAHRDNFYAALDVYHAAELEYPDCHVYLQQQEPETMANRGYITIQSSRSAG